MWLPFLCTNNWWTTCFPLPDYSQEFSIALTYKFLPVSIFLPTTFKSHTGECHIFPVITKKDGQPVLRRIDYVGLPTDWPVANISSNILYDFDTAATKADHYLVLAEFALATITKRGAAAPPGGQNLD